jgi:poly-gamma-glutamate capsule biosynthesis protein CapA/YwtB (metallophosphatase superfamily)
MNLRDAVKGSGLARRAAWAKWDSVRGLAWRLVAPKSRVFQPSSSSIRILFGGDVCFDQTNRMMWNLGLNRLRSGTNKKGATARLRERCWRLLRRNCLSNKFSDRWVDASFDEFTFAKPQNRTSSARDDLITFDIQPPASSRYDYPFEQIAPLLRVKDLVVVNLETPLTEHSRPMGVFKSDPAYARAMKAAGISMVTLANNHVFDGGEIGFLDTIRHLDNSGISYVGAGKNLDDARKGRCTNIRGIEIRFLSYTQFCNSRFASLAAEYPGILPLDRKLMAEDVKAARERAQYVFVALHWGFENQPNVHPRQIEIAHLLIDAGADCIIGHHPHVPHAIEIYKGKPIFYSLGNFIFGHNRDSWSDNLLGEVVVDEKGIQGIILYTISGQDTELFRPRLLTGTRADSLLHELQLKSIIFNTEIAVKNHVGYIAT